MHHGQQGPIHCAFPDYTATAAPATFPDFALALVAELFRRYETIPTECDDCDGWDTYILE